MKLLLFSLRCRCGPFTINTHTSLSFENSNQSCIPPTANTPISLSFHKTDQEVIMTRKKVKLGWIMNDSARKASLKKRKDGLAEKSE